MYINNPGHMTKMATMPIYGKTLKKSSTPEQLDCFQRNLACSTGTGVLQCVYKSLPCDNQDLFNRKINKGHPCI